MQNYTLAAALWLKTRCLRLKDLEVFHSQADLSLSNWQKQLRNANLVEYLKMNPDWPANLKSELDYLKQNHISYSYWGAKDYYAGFLDLEKPPLFYTYKGDISLLTKPMISVVGSRSPSYSVKRWLETHFARFLKTNDISVVSGAARGIDQLSHQIARDFQRATIAVLPSGIGNLYPKSYPTHYSENHLYLSEYSYYEPMRKHYFIQRNRLLANLSSLLFVAEARRRSGSLITANYAMNMGRTICILPSCPSDIERLGTLDLLYDGAIPIRDYLDLEGLMS